MVARRALVALSLAALTLAACGQKPAASSASSDTLTVAATAIPHAEVL
ncbi:MAG TPA: methionine ABC transporter substrate-binding protein, partial [Caulobacter sp.]|nr:methionine ABC transporter substrate-binding protein [Caulobacter sp.]